MYMYVLVHVHRGLPIISEYFCLHVFLGIYSTYYEQEHDLHVYIHVYTVHVLYVNEMLLNDIDRCTIHVYVPMGHGISNL